MVLKGVGKNINGEQIPHKISWTSNSDGAVRQHWQMSQDNEKPGQHYSTVYIKKSNITV